MLAWFGLQSAALGQETTQPAFLSQPQSQTVPAGSDVVFTYLAFNYSTNLWLFNRTNIVTSSPPSFLTSENLFLTNVQAAAAGDYTAVIGGVLPLPDNWMWVTSQVATLTVVPSPPTIIKQDVARTASLGLPASLSVTARGSEPLVFRWQLNGVDIPQATNATLLFSNLQPANAGTYKVYISNAFGLTNSHDIPLSVGPLVKWGAEVVQPPPFGVEYPPPPGLTNVQAIAASVETSAVLDANGTVSAWGYWGGAYGVSNIMSWAVGVAVVRATPQSVFALETNGTVAALSFPYLGAPPYLYEPPSNRANLVDVCGGPKYSLVLQADGTPAVFGRRDLEPPEWAANLVAVAGGDYHVIGLRPDGTVVGWGQLPSASNMPPTLQGVVQIAAASQYSLALKADGRVVGWDSFGTLLTNVPAVLTNAVAISACANHNLALTARGSVLEWWGDGRDYTNPLPTLSNLVAIAAGGTHGLALESDGKPFLLEQPVDQSAIAGQTSVLRAQAAGTWPMRYQWQRDGTNVPGATNWFLAQTAVTPAVAGAYTFVAGNAFGSCTSRVASVRILVPPVITLQPTNQLVAEDDTVTLSVQASGPRLLTYHWKKGNRDLKDDGRISGAASATLALSHARPQDSGVYRVVVSNPDGSASSHLVVLQVGPTTLAAWGENWFDQTYVPSEVSNIIDVVVGGAAIGLKADGTLTWWGGERSGSTLWNGTPPGWSNAVALAAGPGLLALRNDGSVVEALDGIQPPAGLKDVVAIESGWSHYLALKADGTVAAWTQSMDPNAWWRLAWVPRDLTNVVAICAGFNGDLALKADGTLIGWAAVMDRLGQGINLPAGLTNIVAIAGSDAVQFALGADGSVTAWSTWDGSLVPVPAWWTNIVALSAHGSGNCLALNGAGMLYSFGDSFSGTNVPAGLTNVIAVKVTGDSAFAIVGESAPCISTQPLGRTVTPGSDVLFRATASGARPLTYEWEFNGKPIAGATNSALIFSNAQPLLKGVYRVTVSNALGKATSCEARLDFGPVLGWGVNDGGVLDLPPGFTNVAAVQAKDYHGLALDSAGRVSGWGTLWYPNMAVPLELADVKSIAAGATSDLALLNDGTVVAWGTGLNGETAPPAGLRNVVAIAEGEYHELALKADGTVTAWGASPNGQTNVPSDLADVVAIAAGGVHSLALKVDGTVVLWGGDYSPAGAVPDGLSNVVAIAAGSEHSLALQADGTVVAWGGNGFGQTNLPPGLSNVVAIAAGAYHSLALRNDGSVVAWGNPTLGVTDVPSRASNVVALAGGWYSSFALLGDGQPHITVQPFSRTATRCSTVTLTARAVGAGALAYQWQRNGTNVPGATAASLTLQNVQAENNGSYRCLVSNKLGSTASQAATVVVEPLRFDPGSAGVAASEGMFHFRVLGLSGQGSIVLYATSDFQVWEPILTNPPAVSPLDLSLPLPGGSQQFYRVSETVLPPNIP